MMAMPRGGALGRGRAAGGEHRGGQQGRYVARAGRERAAGGDCAGARDRRASAGRGTASGCGGSSSAAAGTAADSERVGDHRNGTEGGHQRGELPADAAHLGAELPAAGAVADVPPGRGVGPHATVVGKNQLIADLRASGVPCLPGMRQAHPRADKQRLDGGNRHAERIGKLEVAHAAELAHQQRGALLIG